jgi:hypothetical protein
MPTAIAKNNPKNNPEYMNKSSSILVSGNFSNNNSNGGDVPFQRR